MYELDVSRMNGIKHKNRTVGDYWDNLWPDGILIIQGTYKEDAVTHHPSKQ